MGLGAGVAPSVSARERSVEDDQSTSDQDWSQHEQSHCDPQSCCFLGGTTVMASRLSPDVFVFRAVMRRLVRFRSSRPYVRSVEGTERDFSHDTGYSACVVGRSFGFFVVAFKAPRQTRVMRWFCVLEV